jgi:Arc/MetJ-type ribon-helix-helix transcriptional regulator
MRTRQTLTISLPPAMAAEVKRVGKIEYRTNSELVREALRFYFLHKLPITDLTVSERSAIQRGRRELESGDYVTLNSLTNDLASKRSAKRR